MVLSRIVCAVGSAHRWRSGIAVKSMTELVYVVAIVVVLHFQYRLNRIFCEKNVAVLHCLVAHIAPLSGHQVIYMKVLHFVISLGSKLTHFVGAVVRKTEIWLFGVLEFDPGSPKISLPL